MKPFKEVYEALQAFKLFRNLSAPSGLCLTDMAHAGHFGLVTLQSLTSVKNSPAHIALCNSTRSLLCKATWVGLGVAQEASKPKNHGIKDLSLCL